jgi:hypothetical protein
VLTRAERRENIARAFYATCGNWDAAYRAADNALGELDFEWAVLADLDALPLTTDRTPEGGTMPLGLQLSLLVGALGLAVGLFALVEGWSMWRRP